METPICWFHVNWRNKKKKNGRCPVSVKPPAGERCFLFQRTETWIVSTRARPITGMIYIWSPYSCPSVMKHGGPRLIAWASEAMAWHGLTWHPHPKMSSQNVIACPFGIWWQSNELFTYTFSESSFLCVYICTVPSNACMHEDTKLSLVFFTENQHVNMANLWSQISQWPLCWTSSSDAGDWLHGFEEPWGDLLLGSIGFSDGRFLRFIC